VEQAGFIKAKDLYQYCVSVTDDDADPPARLVRGAQLAAERFHLTTRPLDMKHLRDDVDKIKQVYNSAWEKNWGFVPLTDAELHHLAKRLKSIVAPEGVVLVEREDQLVGFAALLPDFNVALKKNPSGRLFPGIVKILWSARKINRARLMLLGLLPEYRRTGTEAVLYRWIWEKGHALGFRWAEVGWILEDNSLANNEVTRLGFRRYKTLRLYDRSL
jgi:GNAT superfamily N-acetyltransferase